MGLMDDVLDDQVEIIIEEILKKMTRTTYLPLTMRLHLKEKAFNALRRLDILQPLVDDKSITEIMVNGVKDIFIERNGHVTRLDYSFESQEQLENIIQMIVSKVNRVVNESSPICDARLADGSRINVVLPPIALKGPTLTIRKFPQKPIDMSDLVKWGSISSEVALVLQTLVKAKYNIFICGGTGSGKTTFLNVLSNAIPDDERIITIEDSAELQINKVSNLVSLETRNANVEGRGTITIKDLIKSSLRMRPDRIVVGEVRGHEALDMLQAMNTGHDGSLSTGHGNSTIDMLSRLETMVLTGSAMPLEAIRQQIASAIEVMVHLGRLRDKSRKVLEVVEIVTYKDGQVVMNSLYTFQEDGQSTDEEVSGQLIRSGNRLQNREKLLLSNRKECLPI
ncbi:CpaF family protein [Petrocella sp. FN5]|uniref:CpaF family protein n=1 Tax=Petrocella sp. FN5 TaxID=3032002 RepID=UPI0023DB4496|nr:CpaF family protein [Petrocella sp. FN5]MDF1617094.1 CpaF family protein [Petrocella sp. FN5]